MQKNPVKAIRDHCKHRCCCDNEIARVIRDGCRK